MCVLRRVSPISSTLSLIKVESRVMRASKKQASFETAHRRFPTRLTSQRHASLITLDARHGVDDIHNSRPFRLDMAQLGHEVRRIPAEIVKPYVKSKKNDYQHAETIAEALQRPTMGFVPISSEKQLLHPVCTPCTGAIDG